ncbi:low-specificity L-threonine aldolase [Chryseobacterium mucoviscidosis]|uniref:low-specificity L-threonine aldolase n=1 Tax=unclassified Paenibacillus TaxID=185978 RepID=UPI0009A3BC89|nr:low-specificity L-threonine aldolase [Paenibacillus sp. 11B]MDN8590637.1 low-specificity L-threonine aldolase [Paenibacillus sp. 11B]OPG95123.1 low-specificity L-threonine aldolase [Chryseobacterium mucoviscidosis]
MSDFAKIELRSDTFTLPTPEMLEAMVQAELGDDVYGEDLTVKKLELKAAEMLGKEAAIFMPSGTMANLASIMAHCPRGSKVLVGDESDIYIYEAAGASVCGGIMYEPIRTQADGRLDLEDLQKAIPRDPEDPQFALPGLLCLENPHNRMGGRILPLSYLEDIRAFAKEHQIPVHMDGARIWNASVAMGIPAAVIADYAESLQFCLSKGLSAPIGSMVVGSETFIQKVYRIRKMLGGGMRQAGIVAAAGLVSLNKMVSRLAVDHSNAKRLAEGLSSIPGIACEPQTVETNIVFFRVTDPRFTWQSFVQKLHQKGVHVDELGHGRIRAVTHVGVNSQQIEEVLHHIRDTLA